VPKATITHRVNVLATIRLTIEAPTDGTNNNDISWLEDSTMINDNCRLGQIEGLVRLSIIDVISKEDTSVKSQR
jgi:hypothetical protein